VARIAASDELFGPFSAAILATPLFFVEMDIQAAEQRRDAIRRQGTFNH